MAYSLTNWNLTPKEAVKAQKEWRSLVRIQPPNREINTIAGADISFSKYSEVIYSGIVVLSLPDLRIVETASIRSTAKFPYVPGLLSFRETPSFLECWEKLKTKPDALMLDGQGLAHPRRFGIACHIGLILDLPTIGCAKSILVGQHGELDLEAGSHAPMIDKGEVVGVALRTKRKVNPVFISAGHLMDLDSAIELAMKSVSKYRLPEPTRQAHLLVNQLRREDGID